MGPECSDSVSVRFRQLGSIFRQLFGTFSTALSGIFRQLQGFISTVFRQHWDSFSVLFSDGISLIPVLKFVCYEMYLAWQ